MYQMLGHGLKYALLLLINGSYLKQKFQRLLLDPLYHLGEHGEAFMLVFDEGISLAVSPQAYPFPQAIHAVKVVFPVRIDYLKHDNPLHKMDAAGTHGSPLFGIRALDLRDHLIFDLFRIRLLIHYIRRRHKKPGLQPAKKPGNIPLAGLGGFVEVKIYPLSHNITDHVVDVRTEVRVLQDHFSLFVNYLPLLVHYIIIFQQVLAHIEVKPLNPLLRRFDGPGHQRVLYILSFLHTQLVHDHPDPVGAEYPHQVVLQRKVEPAGTRITLPPGPSAQLVVYSPGLMPPGAQHVQPAELNDLFVLFGNLFLLLLQERFVLIRRLLRLHPSIIQYRLYHEFGASSQDYVCAAAGHVGGNRHRVQPACLGHYLRLSFVVLGIQDVVRHVTRLQHPGELFILLY